MMDVFKKWTRCSILLFVLFAMQSCGPARERSVSRGSYTFPNEGGSITVKGVSSGDVRVELIARNLELFEVLQSGKVFRLTPIGKRRNPAWTSQGERLAYMDGSGGNDGVNIVVYEVSSQEFSVKNNSHPMAANTLSWNRAGDRLAYLSNDQRIVVYDFDLGEEIKLLDVSNPSSSFYIGAENISMSPCGEWIAFSDRDWGSPNEVSNWNVHLLSVGNKEVRNLTESIDTFGITSEIHWEQDGSAFHFNTALLENGRRIGNRRMVYRLDEERLETYEGSIRGKIDQRFRYWRP